jgi:hypothetical protein
LKTPVNTIKKSLNPFDYFYGDDSRCSCFKVENGKIIDPLFISSVDNGVQELKLTFDQYLDNLLKTKGLFSWQYQFIEKHDAVINFDLYEKAFHKFQDLNI